MSSISEAAEQARATLLPETFHKYRLPQVEVGVADETDFAYWHLFLIGLQIMIGENE